MRDGLSRIRTRVDRLRAAVVSSTCDGQHMWMTVSDVQAGEPVPDWPPADAPTRCRCGADLEYRHLVMQHLPE